MRSLAVFFGALALNGAFVAAQLTSITESGTSSAYNSGFPLNPSPNPVGFSPTWTELNTNNGGRFMEGGGAQVGSGRSWGIFSNSGGGNNYAIGRSLSESAAVGSISLVMRHNVDNSVAFTGFNLKTTGAAVFNNGEILSVGLSPGGGNNAIRYNAGTPTSLDFGLELRGAAMTYSAAWNTITGTFSLSASRNGASPLSVSGSLATGNSVAAFGFANLNTGSNQNVLWNDMSISIPEPAQLRTSPPSGAINQATFDVSLGQPQSTTISPVNTGYLTVQNLDAGFTTTIPQFAFAVAAGQLSNAVALLNSRSVTNGYTVTTTPPAWIAALPGSSTFNVFLQYAQPPTGTAYSYWDFSSIPGATVSAVAVVPEPAISAILLAASAMLGRRRCA